MMRTRLTSRLIVLALILTGTMNAQWTELRVGSASLYVSAVTSNANYVYVASLALGGGAYRSSDDGGNWSQCNAGFYSPFVSCLAARNDTLFAGHAGSSSRFYVSTDNGGSWLMRGLSGWNHNSIYLDSNDIFVSTSYGLYKTTNAGSNWTLLLQATNVTSFARNNDCMIVGRQVRGMRCSSNGGAQWDSVSAFGANTITSLITYQNTFCAAVSGVGFAVSTDNGASWTLKNSGLTNLNINVLYKIGSTIFACTQGGGIFKTLNLGSSWTPHNEGISNLNIYSIGVKTPYLYLGSDSGKVYKRLVSELVSVEDKLPTVPERITLEQNYPNPFNPTTTIRYQIPEVSGQSRVTLNVYDLLGRAVGTLVNEDKAPGEHSAGFDATHLPSGVYFYRLTVGSFHEVKKMVLCR